MPGQGMAGGPRGTQSPKPTMKQERAGVGRDDSQFGLSKEHPESTGGQPPPLSVTGGLGLSVPKATEVALTPGSQRGPEALCLSRHSLGTWCSPFRPSAPAVSAGPRAEQMPALGFDPRTAFRDLVFPTILVLGIST